MPPSWLKVAFVRCLLPIVIAPLPED